MSVWPLNLLVKDLGLVQFGLVHLLFNILQQLTHFSEPQFSSLQNGNNES